MGIDYCSSLLFGLGFDSQILRKRLDDLNGLNDEVDIIYIRETEESRKRHRDPDDYTANMLKTAEKDEEGWVYVSEYLYKEDLEEDIELYKKDGYEVKAKREIPRWESARQEPLCEVVESFIKENKIEGLEVKSVAGICVIYVKGRGSEIGGKSNCHEMIPVYKLEINQGELELLSQFAKKIGLKGEIGWFHSTWRD